MMHLERLFLFASGHGVGSKDREHYVDKICNLWRPWVGITEEKKKQ